MSVLNPSDLESILINQFKPPEYEKVELTYEERKQLEKSAPDFTDLIFLEQQIDTLKSEKTQLMEDNEKRMTLIQEAMEWKIKELETKVLKPEEDIVYEPGSFDICCINCCFPLK